MEVADTLEDGFQTLILREVLLADGLKADIDKAKIIEELGKTASGPASAFLAAVASSKLTKAGGAVVGALSKKAIIAATESGRALYAIRVARKNIQRIVGDSESTAHSCCRAALCYALSGDYETAEAWLIDAEKLVDDLARPNFIRGLCAGANGDPVSARKLLMRALERRGKLETKGRIQEALELAREDP